MSTKSDCKMGGETLGNGNCTNPGPDGLPVQCVGPWAADKHYYLRQYIEATRAVRADYLPPKGKGGAAFVDLFAGPGMVRERDTGAIRDGSPMVALGHTAAPFTRLVLCDLDPDNIRALRERTSSAAHRVIPIEGDCNKQIDKIIEAIPEFGLNIALIDPFALQALKFSTIQRLAAFKRMDLVIHFPTADIKRNLGHKDSTRGYLDEALGTKDWESKISSNTDVARLIEIFKAQLATLGYLSTQVRSQPIKNGQNLPLYYLVYASKNPRGDKIWQSITRNTPGGQRGFGFD
jgi:three-Cys-motif partner protein